ncbi:MAG: sigma-70 family RNA polymerase sigma factor [Firmicutes bacterium]|nr:sigma-70 family RNA polymerase sigma factor [Bacillota bacterium]
MAEFGEIYNAYFKDIYLYIYSLSGDRHTAEDITSETFLKALESIDSFRGTCDLRVWLCQIAKNSYFSYLRREKKFVNMEKIPEKAAAHDVERIITLSEASMKAHDILRNLGEPYRGVFSLRHFNELSFKKIAALFGKSENWACVTYHRARKKIKKQMEGYR